MNYITVKINCKKISYLNITEKYFPKTQAVFGHLISPDSHAVFSRTASALSGFIQYRYVAKVQAQLPIS